MFVPVDLEVAYEVSVLTVLSNFVHYIALVHQCPQCQVCVVVFFVFCCYLCPSKLGYILNALYYLIELVLGGLDIHLIRGGQWYFFHE